MPEQLRIKMQQETFRDLTQRLVSLAEEEGLVITVSQVPKHPLAMGHYETRVDVRPARSKS